ncbi:Na+/H+ antiporter subunit E [Microbulbifer guangxiensis]|uniref:Na+/H+ antiporter subunit E n=1 Tax=Microbulbifer guangxiensis TaxID=2904249 RepID=UPI001F2536D4|nr:Na+/H+ antiporter subunit E [Microbulbifer guangxiensis]
MKTDNRGRADRADAHYSLYLVVVLSVIWLGNSGHYSPLLLTFGVVSVALVVWIGRRMQVVDGESQPFHLSLRLLAYYGWLLRKIVESNIKVAACAWKGPRAISPVSGRVPCRLESDLSRVIYANSITLTPGTVTVSLDDGEVLVHALTESGLAELREGEMEGRVARLEQP